MKQEYFLGYVSANETNFLQDFVNIYLMTRHNPGVPKIHLYLIFSETKNPTIYQEKAFKFLSHLISKCSWLDLKEVLSKSNIGRDFSSANLFLSKISCEVSSNDIIMIRNRSSHGPFMENWYLDYVDLLKSKENIGLVGNTINFYNLKQEFFNTTHVQTYIYVSFWRVLKPLIGNFPGASETEKSKVIDRGEIGLSQKIMEMGFNISCLEWPSRYFNIENQIDQKSVRKDFKSKVKGLPFLHRENSKYKLWKFFLKSCLLFLYVLKNLGNQILSKGNK